VSSGFKRALFATQNKLAYLGFQCLDHPPYSPELAPSDYHLFPGLKKKIEISPFFVLRAAEVAWLDGQHFDFFLSNLQKFEQRAKKCTELREVYVE